LADQQELFFGGTFSKTLKLFFGKDKKETANLDFDHTNVINSQFQNILMTINKTQKLLAGTLALVFAMGLASPAFAVSTFICDGLVEHQTIDANVVVPKGETCQLAGVEINGNVDVKKDAEFIIVESSDINGNISAKGAASIDIWELNLEGNLSALNGEDVSIQYATTIRGNVNIIGNGSVLLFEQSIFGNVKVIQNSEVDMADMGIGGNLDLLGNGLVLTGTDDFGVFAAGNATCLNNDDITGEFTAQGKNKGCPTP